MARITMDEPVHLFVRVYLGQEDVTNRVLWADPATGEGVLIIRHVRDPETGFAARDRRDDLDVQLVNDAPEWAARRLEELRRG